MSVRSRRLGDFEGLGGDFTFTGSTPHAAATSWSAGNQRIAGRVDEILHDSR